MSFIKRTGHPLKIFLLDILAIPFVLVSTLKLAGNMDIVPVALQFENYEWYAMAIGIIFLMSGYIFTIIIRKEKTTRPSAGKKDDKAL